MTPWYSIDQSTLFDVIVFYIDQLRMLRCQFASGYRLQGK
jgi:hypothetical protein